MICVNAVYKTRLNEDINLDKVANLFSNLQSKLYVGRPTQLKIKCSNNIVCLLFSKSAIRIMGKRINLCDATSILFTESLPLFTNARPMLEVQTMTFVGYTGFEVNLKKFANDFENELQTFYNFEIFCALRIINKFKPISVNLFSSKKIVLCGGKCEYQAERIISLIIYYCCCV